MGTFYEPAAFVQVILVALTCGESPLPTVFMWLPDAEGLMNVSA